MDTAKSGIEPSAHPSPGDWFLRTDAGRSSSRRPRQRNDCTVRALTVAFDISYDDAHGLLAESGRATGKRFDFRSWSKDAAVAGKRFVWRAFPAIKGERRMDPERFSACHPRGTYVLKTAKHVIACVDGIIHDDERPRPGRCVYGAWAVTADLDGHPSRLENR